MSSQCFPLLKLFLFLLIFRERGRQGGRGSGRETYQSVVAFMHSSGAACTGPRQGSNQQPWQMTLHNQLSTWTWPPYFKFHAFILSGAHFNKLLLKPCMVISLLAFILACNDLFCMKWTYFNAMCHEIKGLFLVRTRCVPSR